MGPNYCGSNNQTIILNDYSSLNDVCNNLCIFQNCGFCDDTISLVVVFLEIESNLTVGSSVYNGIGIESCQTIQDGFYVSIDSTFDIEDIRDYICNNGFAPIYRIQNGIITEEYLSCSCG